MTDAAASAASAVGRRAGIFGAAVGVLAVGAAAGVAIERMTVGRVRRRAEAELDAMAEYGTLRGETHVVSAPDGVELYAEVDGVPDAPLTVVLCHGYTLNMDCWHFQRAELMGEYRLVLFDQRSHGRSGRGAPETSTIDQLGTDLYAVLQELVPDGPMVLVGHSMGGMTIMALADQHPELFGTRVVGVALMNTSSGKWATVTLGIPAAGARLVHRVAPGVLRTLGKRAGLVEAGRRAARDLVYVFTERYAFDSEVDPAIVRFTDRMISATPIDVIAEFFPAFETHDKLAALPVLGRVPTLVVGGEGDLMAPASHSEAIHEVVPDSELVVVPESGHLTPLEHPEVVNAALRGLLARAARACARRNGTGGGSRRSGSSGSAGSQARPPSQGGPKGPPGPGPQGTGRDTSG
ncbi:alpha/beta fold hydrolase [Yinghuangia seranimata]|uniref:alpha/beta fold hydrolase n=1 Tax=Yinghuangia seranimata TaxID=408067 RepID=UPI00248B0ECB|nr:alpha/beta hydrolase [Yinghuangia seranimata]MDI2126848.1 alpha/beta hydrolase [Yinghuangia seranimata]